MSLETYLQENTRAILALTEILKNGLGATVVSPDALEEQVLAEPAPEAPKAKRAKKETVPVGEPAAAPSAPAPASGATAAEATADAARPTEVTRDMVSKALTTLANKKGREAAMSVLNAVGAKNLGEVAVGDYGTVLRACEKSLA